MTKRIRTGSFKEFPPKKLNGSTSRLQIRWDGSYRSQSSTLPSDPCSFHHSGKSLVPGSQCSFELPPSPNPVNSSLSLLHENLSSYLGAAILIRVHSLPPIHSSPSPPNHRKCILPPSPASIRAQQARRPCGTHGAACRLPRRVRGGGPAPLGRRRRRPPPRPLLPPPPGATVLQHPPTTLR
jgi:hypothetical protein